MNEVDFTSCQRIPGRAYNGANGKKIAVDWQGACWILKFPPSAAEKPDDLKAALDRVLPRIDLDAICAFVDGVPYASDLQKRFYRHYLVQRRQKLFA